MLQVHRMTPTEINRLIPNRAASYLGVDVASRRTFREMFGGHRTDHFDTTPATPTDAAIAEAIIRSDFLRQWLARPTVFWLVDRWVAFGLCYRMHHIRIGGGNPGAKYPSLNDAVARNPDGTWKDGGHRCNYPVSGVGGAGRAPNNSVGAEANRLARLLRNGEDGGQARAAAEQAFISGNTALFLEFLATITPGGSTPPGPSPAPPLFRIGDEVRFVGTQHFSSAGATQGAPARPGTAKITDMVDLSRPNPYHVVRVHGGGSDVHGWVPASSIVALVTSPPPPSTPLKIGDTVRIRAGATNFDSGAVAPNWILGMTWIIHAIRDNRIVVNHDTTGQYAIMFPTHANNLTRV